MNDRDCKMHEFTLHSATKYKDGTPIMSEPEVDVNSSYPQRKAKKNSMYGKVAEQSNQLDSNLRYLEQAFKDMDSVLAAHAGKINSHTDTLEEHLDRICELEHRYAEAIDYLLEVRDKMNKIAESFIEHKGSNFCGNCAHAESKDGICTCKLNRGITDPDASSCEWFEPSYSHNPEWFDNMKKAMTTPSEPSVGCTDCKYAIHGMCEKYNCSLGTICATPECHESFPF